MEQPLSFAASALLQGGIMGIGLLMSQICLRPARRYGFHIFLTGCAASAGLMIQLGSFSPGGKQGALLIYSLTILGLGFYHLLPLFGKGKNLSPSRFLYLFSAISHVDFLFTCWSAGPGPPLWEIFLFLSAAHILVVEARGLALYFGEVEDLSYSLNVSNAPPPLRKARIS